jgi:pyridoxine 5-phosphate synthase
MTMRVKLGVNIDHVATLRQARRGVDPDPVLAARACWEAGADMIVCHLRSDRRHIQDEDVFRLRKQSKLPLHLEMASAPEMVRVALKLRPETVCLVPEKPGEVTTEGGLNISGNAAKNLKKAVSDLKKAGIEVSLFVDPAADVIREAKKLGADTIELCTTNYAKALGGSVIKSELETLQLAAYLARELKLSVHAGHGLDYHNVRAVGEIPGVEALNIGFSIISRALFVGLKTAVSEMRRAIAG